MWAAYTFASLLLIMTLVLCVPVDITLSFDTSQKPKFSARLRWLFGLATGDLANSGKTPDHKPHQGRNKLEFGTALDVLRTQGLAGQFFRLVRDLWRKTKLRELSADLKIGLENPSDLGMLFAFLAPLNLLIRYFSPHHIVLQPNFTEEAFLQGYARGTIRMQPVLLVLPVAGFIFSRPGLTAIKKLILAKWRKTR